MTDQPDSAPQADRPVRQTALQVATAAQELAVTLQAALQRMSAQLAEVQARVNKALPTTPALELKLTEGLQALRDETDGFMKAVNRRLEAASPGGGRSDAEIVAVVDATLAPMIEGANRKLEALDARLADYRTGDQVIAQVDSRVAERVARELDAMLKDPRLQAAGNAAQQVVHQDVAETVRKEVLSALDSPALQAMLEGDLDQRVMQLVESNLEGVVRRRAAFEQDLLARLTKLEQDLPTWSRTGPRPAVPAVHGKVLELMRRVTAIGKERQANAGDGGRYKFRGIDEAMDAVGHAMREVGLTLKTKVLSVEHDQTTSQGTDNQGRAKTRVWTTTWLTMRYTFVDPTDSSEHPFEMTGEGRALDDKASSKAASMAAKYGLFQALMIPVTGLDESDGETPVIERDTDRPARPDSQPRAQQDQPSNPPPPAADQAFNRQERAHAALTALRNLGHIAPSQRHAELARIRNKIQEQDLASVEVDGMPLRAHAVAIGGTLPREGS